MMVPIIIFLLAILASCAVGAPTNVTFGAPKSGCYVMDFQNLDWAMKNCMEVYIDNMRVPKLCKTLFVDLKDGAKLKFKNRIVFDYCEFEGPMITIRGNNIYVEGEKGSVLDGQGALYWDGQGGHGRQKPFFVRITATNSVFKNINVLNCPKNCVSVYACYNVVLDGWNVDVAAGDAGVAPKGKEGVNTDGFGIIFSTNIVLENSYVHNQDDCVVINTGLHMFINNVHCKGPTHGLSIAVGEARHHKARFHKEIPVFDKSLVPFDAPPVPDSHVENITFKYCSLTGAMNGIHVKTLPGDRVGRVKDILYRNIAIKDVYFHGIIVREDYGEWGHPEANIPISNLVIDNFRGNVVGRDAIGVYIICAKGGCSNFNWRRVEITHSDHGGKPNDCNYQPNGFTC